MADGFLKAQDLGGTTVATDDVAGTHYQRIKLNSATADSTNNIGDDVKESSTNALWTVERPNRTDQTIASTGLTTATTAYTIGDVLGNGWTFTNMARATGGGGWIRHISFVDRSDVMGAATLFFFSGAVTFGTDNAAPSISDADADKFLFSVAIATPTDLGGVRVTTTVGPWAYTCDATSLFCYAITGTANAVFAGGADSIRIRILGYLD